MGCKNPKGNTQERNTERVVVCIKQSNQIEREERGARESRDGKRDDSSKGRTEPKSTVM